MAGRITQYIQKASIWKLLAAVLILEVIFYFVPHIDYALRVHRIKGRLEERTEEVARGIDGTLHRFLVNRAAYNSLGYHRLAQVLREVEQNTLPGQRIWARTLDVAVRRRRPVVPQPLPEPGEVVWRLRAGVTTQEESNIGLTVSRWKAIEDFISDPEMSDSSVSSPYRYEGHYGTHGPWWISAFAWIKTQRDMPAGIVELAADVTGLRRGRKTLSYILMLIGPAFFLWVGEVKLGIVATYVAPYLALRRARARERAPVRALKKEKRPQYARVSGEYFSMEYRKGGGIKTVFRTSAPYFAEVVEIRQTGLEFSTAEPIQAYSLIWLKLTSPFLSRDFTAVGRIVGARQNPRDPERFIYSLDFLRRRFEVAKLVKR